MKTASAVVADLAALRGQLHELGVDHSGLLGVQPLFVLRDVVFDTAVVLGAVWMVHWLGLVLVPLALVLVGNRQRALGNVLHDASHGNLSRSKARNDAVAGYVIAPLLFADFAHYRKTHQQHHIWLGDLNTDPDYLQSAESLPRNWAHAFGRFVFTPKVCVSSIGGHLVARELGFGRKAFIVLWWAGWLSLLVSMAGGAFALVFALVWLASRATSFHLITTFREMCDHFGLHPGGVLSFTRDIVGRSPWRWLIHPRNNGYHLTHHLLPAVPYHRLPDAQALLQTMPLYRRRATVCAGYFSGANPVTPAWASRGYL